jgi:hypothetical protein
MLFRKKNELNIESYIEYTMSSIGSPSSPSSHGKHANKANPNKGKSTKGKSTKKSDKPKHVGKKSKRPKPPPTVKPMPTKICDKCKMLLPYSKFAYHKNIGSCEATCKKCKYTSDKPKKPKKARKQIDPQEVTEATVFTMRRMLHRVLSRQTVKTARMFDAGAGLMMKWINFNLELDQSSGMTLENRGKIWHLYYVIPPDKFNLLLKKEKLKCINWTNIKPMIAKKNKHRQESLILEQCLEQELRLKKFGKQNNIKIGNSTIRNWVRRGGVLTTAASEKSYVQQEVQRPLDGNNVKNWIICSHVSTCTI